MPLTQDHCSQGDVAITCGDVVGEGQARTDGEECTTQSSKTRSENGIEGSSAIDVDADSVGCPRVLTAGAKTQAPTRTVQVNRQENYRGIHQVDQDVVVEEHRANDRDFSQDRDLDIRERELIRVEEFGLLRHPRSVEESRQTRCQDIQDHTDDDLIHAVLDREEGQEASQESTRDRRCDKTGP